MNSPILDPDAHGASGASLDGVSVSFGAVKALTDATLHIHAGQCIALVGHNGAGKSTLVNVLNGRLTPTSGTVTHTSPEGEIADPRKAGVRSVFQELSLCPNLTVTENFRIPFLRMPWTGWRQKAAKSVVDSLDTVFPGHGIDPKAIVGDLSIAERQMVEVAIAFSRRDIAANLVILDEPTSSLDASIASQLLGHVRKFCNSGGSVVFISHMLGEVFAVADRIVVMKDGRITEDRPAQFFDRDSLVHAMGHAVPTQSQGSAKASVTNIQASEVVRFPNGLNAREGEIVGLAGLAGHGQAEALANFYFGQSSAWRASRKPRAVFVAGDRARDGIFPLWSIQKNLSLQTLVEKSGKMLINFAEEAQLTEIWRDRIGIRTDNVENPILSLSGGNQQKVLFAKALSSGAPVVLMDDPMRGVDVGTKKEVYKMIREEAAKGRTFLWYSTETDEILECDRVFVFRDNEISAELSGNEITEENMLRASFQMQEAAE